MQGAGNGGDADDCHVLWTQQNISDRRFLQVAIILPSLIEGGAATFYLGGYGDFDSLAAAAVRRQKAVYPHITAILVLAYLNRETDTSRYDDTTYPPLENVPPRYAIVRRNEWMVRESDVVISGVTHGWGGAAKTLDYARRKQKIIFQFPTQAQRE